MLIPRTVAEHEVEELLSYFPAVGIVGARQVGKTSLAKKIAEKKENALFLDLQLSSAQLQLSDAESFLRQRADRFVVLDEIQTSPELFPILRGLIDEGRSPGRFLILGSAAPELLRSTGESLAGRIAYHELTGFSASELPSPVDIDLHWLRGGYPEAYFMKDAVRRLKYVDAYIRTFVATDLRDIAGGTDPKGMQRIISMIAHSQGNTLNASQLARSLGVTSPTSARYLDILESAFLITRLQPYLPNLRKRLVRSPKIFIRDSGLLHGLLGIQSLDALLGHPVVGASWEGYVREQLSANLPLGMNTYHFRTATGDELDLILEFPNRSIWAIEIKRSNSPKLSKGFYTCLEELKPLKTFVVVPQIERVTIQKSVEVIGLLAAIKEIESIQL